MLWNAIEFACWADGSGSEGEAGVGEEPGDQLVAGADALDAVLGRVGDLAQGGAGQVGQLGALEVGPQVLHRVELGRMGGQPLGPEPVALAVQPGPVGVRYSVPQATCASS